MTRQKHKKRLLRAVVEGLERRELLASNPLVYYTADSITSSTLTDSSGDGYNGTIHGSLGSTYSAATGQINGALGLSATQQTNGYVSLPGAFNSSLQGVTNFSVTGWLKMTSVNDWARLFDFGSGTTKYMFLAPAAGDGLPRFSITTGGDTVEQTVSGTSALSAGQWYFLAVTLSGSTATLYVNGSAVGSNSSITLSPASLGPTNADYIGRSQFSDPNLQGSVDDFRVFSTALSSSTISTMYGQGLSASPDLGFESPSEGTSYAYEPAGTNWTFAGNSGIAADGSGFAPGSGHGGSQVGFIQSAGAASSTGITGAISQPFYFSTAGSYVLSLNAAERSHNGLNTQSVGVYLDGSSTPISTITPTSSTFAVFNTSQFAVTAGIHAISFTGTVSAGDQTAFIDDISTTLTNNAAPTIATPAAASPNPVNGTTTNLSVLGADDGGESNLTYTWSLTGTPPASVNYSANGTNAAKNTAATFSKAGTYNFLVTVTDSGGLTTTSSVVVTVNQVFSGIGVTPASAMVFENGTQQFAASALDQFGNAMTSQPSFTWHQSGIGSINSSSGLYSAPGTTGSAAVNASSGAFTSSNAAINVIPPEPTVVTAASANPSPVTGTTTALSVLGTDPMGESNLTYTWSLTGTPPAAVMYSANGTNAAKNTTATFTNAGTYNFLVTLTDTNSATATSSVSVTVNQTLSSLTVSPSSASIALNATQQFAATAYDQFGNPMVSQPSFSWTSTGNAGSTGNTAVGSVNGGGLFTSSGTAGSGAVSAAAGGFFATAMISSGSSPLLSGTTDVSTFGTNAYYTGDTNSCAIAVDNIWTDIASNYQFAAYYTTASEIMIARRQVGSSTWQVFDSGIADSSISDDHDVISIAVDSTGYLHMSWGMHNITLQYAISNSVVTTPILSGIPFTQMTSSNAPTLFPNGGADTNEVTYPQFYAIPNSPNLLFAYRNGGSGGGSGNGNEYIDVYSPGTRTWSHTFMVNGELTSVNAYLNRMVYDASGNLLSSWTWRATPNWQSNSNIMFAQSPDNGTTWYQQGGTTQYTLPIIQSGTPASSVAQVIENIPENDSFINQVSMTVDNSGNPIIAGYDTPNWNVSAQTGDPNRQYMLFYYLNGQWRTSQITSRTSDTSIDTSGSDVRDLGRPIVLVDKQGRVLVITRSQDTSMGAYASTSTPNNVLTVYCCTNLSTGSPTWNSITLNTTDMGEYEPTYDQNLWNAKNILSLYFQPMGLSGQTAASAQVLDWNEASYFLPVSYPASAGDGFYVRLAPDGVTEQVWVGTPGSVGPAFSANPTYSGTLAGISSLTFGPGSSANGAITIDASNGSPIPSGGISYDGGGGINTLTLIGGNGNQSVSIGANTLSLGSSSITFANTTTISLTLGSGSDTLTQTAQPNATVVWNDPTSSDTLTVNGGSFNFPVPASAGITPISLSALNIGANAAVSLPVSITNRYVTTLSSLSIAGTTGAWTGTLDLGSNDLILHSGNLATTEDQTGLAASGGAPGAHKGIMSSIAAGDTTHLTTLGVVLNTAATTFETQSVSNGDVLIRYTYFGDTTLDGIVDGSDYSRIDNGYLNHLTGWNNGDLNYDGIVNGSDYTLIDNAFNRQGAVQLAQFAAQTAVPILNNDEIDQLKRKRKTIWM